MSREAKKGTDGAFYENRNLECQHVPYVLTAQPLEKAIKISRKMDQTQTLLHPNSFVFINAEANCECLGSIK